MKKELPDYGIEPNAYSELGKILSRLSLKISNAISATCLIFQLTHLFTWLKILSRVGIECRITKSACLKF